MAEAAGSGAPTVAVPVPGLAGPARRISPERRLRLAAVLAGYVLLAFAIVYLMGGLHGDWLAAAWPLLLVWGCTVLLICLSAQGEIRSGPGWIAVRRVFGWQVVTAATLATARVKPAQYYGFLLRLQAQGGRQHVDLTPRALSRPAAAEAALALVDDASARGAVADPAVWTLSEILGYPERRPGVSEEVRSGMADLHRAHGRHLWLSRLLGVLNVAFLSLAWGFVALVIIVRLVGHH